MILNNLVDTLPIKSRFIRMIIGSTIAALAIALGIHGAFYILGYETDAGIPAAFAAIGASLFASRYHKEKNS